MNVHPIIVEISVWLSWILLIGSIFGIFWVLWVYVNDLPSHSEMTEREENEMLSGPEFYRNDSMEGSANNV